MDGQAVDAVAPAIEDRGEWTVVGSFISLGAGQIQALAVLPAVPYGQPATGSRVEMSGVAVIGIQADGAVARPGPGAAVQVSVKAEIVHQLVPEAAGLGAAKDIRCCTRSVNAAGAGQVVPHVVQVRQAGDLDETIAVGISQAG